jgi:hypothetical protein
MKAHYRSRLYSFSFGFTTKQKECRQGFKSPTFAAA